MQSIYSKVVRLTLLLALQAIVCNNLHAKQEKEAVEQVKEGNFLLPLSQQPSPLFSLGQNVLEKGDCMAFLAVFPFFGPKKHSVGVIPYFLYGINDSCSIGVAVPSSFIKDDCLKASGLGDIFAQLEYSFYELKTPSSTHQATVLTAFYLPTGSTKSGTPALGAGAPSFLFGGTFSYYSPDWLWFLSAGGNLETKGRRLRAGSNFLYQGGFGKNITTHKGWIFTWMIELDGIYTTRDQFCSATVRNSGGNVLFLTPSFWASSERFIAQAGISLLPVQHLFGCQTRNEIGALISLGWKFNA